MSNKNKHDSPLVKSVLALDTYLAELERIGTKINSTNMTSDIDIEHLQKLMHRFGECGQGVSNEVSNLSTHLQDARTRAEGVAQGVAAQAELLNQRVVEQNEKLERLRTLGEKISQLNASLGQFRQAGGQAFTAADHEKLTSAIPALESQFATLIEELQDLRQSARNSRMKALEKNADSLAQTLQAVRKRLLDLRE